MAYKNMLRRGLRTYPVAGEWYTVRGTDHTGATVDTTSAPMTSTVTVGIPPTFTPLVPEKPTRKFRATISTSRLAYEAMSDQLAFLEELRRQALATLVDNVMKDPEAGKMVVPNVKVDTERDMLDITFELTVVVDNHG